MVEESCLIHHTTLRSVDQMSHNNVVELNNAVVTEAEIRCYRLAAGTLSYEVFLIFGGGVSWASGHLASWEEALLVARTRVAQHKCPAMFKSERRQAARRTE